MPTRLSHGRARPVLGISREIRGPPVTQLPAQNGCAVRILGGVVRSCSAVCACYLAGVVARPTSPSCSTWTGRTVPSLVAPMPPFLPVPRFPPGSLGTGEFPRVPTLASNPVKSSPLPSRFPAVATQDTHGPGFRQPEFLRRPGMISRQPVFIAPIVIPPAPQLTPYPVYPGVKRRDLVASP